MLFNFLWVIPRGIFQKKAYNIHTRGKFEIKNYFYQFLKPFMLRAQKTEVNRFEKVLQYTVNHTGVNSINSITQQCCKTGSNDN